MVQRPQRRVIDEEEEEDSEEEEEEEDSEEEDSEDEEEESSTISQPSSVRSIFGPYDIVSTKCKHTHPPNNLTSFGLTLM